MTPAAWIILGTVLLALALLLFAASCILLFRWRRAIEQKLN